MAVFVVVLPARHGGYYPLGTRRRMLKCVGGWDEVAKGEPYYIQFVQISKGVLA